MKNITKILMTTLILFFTSCGGGGGSNNVENTTNTETIIKEENNRTTNTDDEDTGEIMQMNTSYSMQAGKTIVRTQDETIIELETDIETGTSIAKLIKGGAKIE